MSKEEIPIVSYLKELISRRKISASQLAVALGVSRSTVHRWLNNMDVPNIRSCNRLAEYSGASVDKILGLVGHLPQMAERGTPEWPEFREYASQKYPEELDEDLITMIEYLIERRRWWKNGGQAV